MPVSLKTNYNSGTDLEIQIRWYFGLKREVIAKITISLFKKKIPSKKGGGATPITPS